MMFLDCPAYLDKQGGARCGLPAEVRCRFVMRSTDGPLESAVIRCPAGHWFNGPIESLTWNSTGKPARALPGVLPGPGGTAAPAAVMPVTARAGLSPGISPGSASGQLAARTALLPFI
jgi:hypothetical protein